MAKARNQHRRPRQNNEQTRTDLSQYKNLQAEWAYLGTVILL
jgi:hypothetical protein